MNVSTSQLENRLSSTDKSINQTGDKTSETLALLDSEIRKLWTIANKRNKGAIGENKKTTVALDKALAKVKKTADLAKNQLVQVKESNTLILATNKDLANTILSLNSTIAELEAQLGMQDSKLITLQQDLNKVAQQANLSDEVQSNAQAIQAIDAYRRQTNSSIEQLNQDIRNLYQRTAAEGTVSKPGL
ncbi:MAG: hypothetical protein JKY67_16835 [Pseudomonadales bacterium]|nr:hypothetical protein [Pseudomonadales bacterium]